MLSIMNLRQTACLAKAFTMRVMIGVKNVIQVFLRIPAIHDVRPDMTHITSNARLLIISMACNVIHMAKPQKHIFSAHFRVMYSRYP